MDVAIAGAGISGLAAAISLRRSGHRVTIYERSSMNNELGAAINIPSNVSRFLVPWGLDPVRSRLVNSQGMWFVSPTTLEEIAAFDHSHNNEKFGSPLYYAHRVDLHESLKRMATEPGFGTPVEIRLKSIVTSYDSGTPSLTLQDGTIITADVILAADGVNSIASQAILGKVNAPEPAKHSNCCYRFLISREQLMSDPETKWFTEGHQSLGCRIYPDHQANRRLVSYTCRDHEVFNFVGICHNNTVFSKEKEDWLAPIDKSEVLAQFSGYSPKLLAIISKATEVKRWPLLYRSPIRTWQKGKMAVAGDAAHPMLPHQGQGGAQGIEDGVAFGLVFQGVTDKSQIRNRLELYEKIRRNRAASVQILSNFGADEEVPHELVEYLDGVALPKNVADIVNITYGHDVIKHATKVLKDYSPEWELGKDFYPAKIAVA